MWNLGRAYLQIGWDPSDERPRFFTIFGTIIGSAVLFFASLFVCALLFHGFIPEQIKGGLYTKGLGLYPVSLIFLSVALGFLPVLLHLRRKLNCSFKDAFLGKNKLNLPWFLGTVAVTWATYALVGMSFSSFQTSSGYEHHGALPYVDQPILIPFLLIAILFQSAAEELVFRGYFSKALYLFGRSIMLVFVVTPVLFALYHQRFNPWMLLTYCEVGVFYSYVSLRTGGLQVSTALHFANNSFVALSGGLMKAASTSNSELVQSVLGRTITIVVIALFLEVAWRTVGMHGRNTDKSMPPAMRDLRAG